VLGAGKDLFRCGHVVLSIFLWWVLWESLGQEELVFCQWRTS
jgi:hypothetical protein